MASAARRMGDRAGLYMAPPGNKPLRQQIVRHAVEAGCTLDADEIVVTAGCGEAVSSCLQAVCRPGDTVAVESPICFDVFQYMENLGLKALEIPTHPRDGISLEALRFALENNSVQACIVISNFNNPLGSCIPDEHKKTLVGMLAARDIPLIENDIFGDIHFSAKRPLSAKAYDTKGLVLWCASFSKTLSPGLRVGWAAPGRFRSTVSWLKYSTSLAAATLPQVAVAQFMADGGYRQHLRRIRRLYRDRVAELRRALIRFFPPDIRVTDPSGGYLLWIELPEQIDSLALYKRALKEGHRHHPRPSFFHRQPLPEFYPPQRGQLVRGGGACHPAAGNGYRQHAARHERCYPVNAAGRTYSLQTNRIYETFLVPAINSIGRQRLIESDPFRLTSCIFSSYFGFPIR